MAEELKLGNIKPVGADNVVVEGKYVKGGYVVVATTTERDNLKGSSGENIVNGSLCYCTGDSKFYQYNGAGWVEAKLGGLDSHGLLSFTQSDPLSGTSVKLLNTPIRPTQYDEMYSKYHWAQNSRITSCGFHIIEGHTYAVYVPPESLTAPGNTVNAIRPDYIIVTDVLELYATGADNPYGWQHTDVTFSSLGSGYTSGYAYGTLTFVAPCTGYAFVEEEDRGALSEAYVFEPAPDTVIITGNLQINGNLMVDGSGAGSNGECSFDKQNVLSIYTGESSTIASHWPDVKPELIGEYGSIYWTYNDATTPYTQAIPVKAGYQYILSPSPETISSEEPGFVSSTSEFVLTDYMPSEGEYENYGGNITIVSPVYTPSEYDDNVRTFYGSYTFTSPYTGYAFFEVYPAAGDFIALECSTQGRKVYIDGDLEITGNINLPIGDINRPTQEGFNTQAIGDASHAEGSNTQAIGDASHAEGHTTIAKGEASHTEGAQTQALGTYTHAEGWNTLALTDGAHSEGAYTKALGLTSHTEGHTTKAAGEASHAEGVRTRTLGRGSHAEGYYTKAFSDRSHAGGYKTAAGMTGLRYVLMQKNVPSSGKTTFYIDGDVTAKLSREDTCSIITNNEYVNYGKAEAITLTEIPEGQASLFTQSNATLIVFNGADFAADNTVDLTKDPYKKTIFVIDKPELGLVLSEDILEELNKEDPGEGVNNNKTIDVGTNAFAVGVQSRALGYGSAAFGKDTVAYGSYAFVEGRLTEAMYAAHAEGRETKALGDVSHAEGYQTKAIAAYAHAEGAQTHAEEQAAHAEGYNTYATNLYTHAEGQITNASGVASHTEGYNTAAGGDFTTNTLTGGTLSTSGAYAHAEGNATVAIGQAAHAEGRETFAKGKYAHAEGYRTSAIGDRSHAEGANDKTFSSRKAEVKDLGGTSLFTYNTTGFAEGESSHKEGYNTTAFGKYSHAEGSGSLAHGEKSHAEGSNTNATGSSAHAEGAGTSAYGPQSHAEGYKTNALGSYSHAECEQTWATGQAAHAEGQLSKATNTAAHAEGYNTTASGIGAHAEGSGTTASGDASHASGVGTKATANYQTVIGKYNKEDSDALFIVGCGTGDATNQRANAFTAGQDGENYITIGDTKITSSQLAALLAMIGSGGVGSGGSSSSNTAILSGSSLPTADIGKVGDIYIVI